MRRPAPGVLGLGGRRAAAMLAGAGLLGGLALGSPIPRRARAHGPAPAVLEVLHPRGGEGGAPGALRTSVGLALPRADGAYDYACPSQWGGNERAQGAARPDGQVLVMVADGDAHVSVDGGCRFERRPAPSGGRVTSVVWSESRWAFVLLVAPSPDEVDAASQELLLLDGGGRQALEHGGGIPEADLVVDAAFTDAEGRLLAVGARPRPSLWLAQAGEPGPEDAAPSLRDLPIPEELGDRRVTRVAPIAGAARHPDGPNRWFLRLSLDDGAETAVATLHLPVATEPEGEAPTPGITLEHVSGTTLHGPAVVTGPDGETAEAWLLAGDQLLHRAPPAGEIDGTDPAVWRTTASVDGWRCLHGVGDRLYACTFDTALVEVLSPDSARPGTAPAFTFSQLDGPPEGCPAADPSQPFDPALLCALDWQHFAGESGWLGLEPATSPGGPRTAPDGEDRDPEGGEEQEPPPPEEPGPAPGPSEGCRVAPTAPGPGLPGLAILLAAALTAAGLRSSPGRRASGRAGRRHSDSR
ncbi:MAG TPA: hypothetical protein RMF84_12370 [Polyangiaceae bacterium LLY-WYZ-14_1]|nr:hypothetical protein [Polyangiaceae bacterium LLY-WYZ-14_1]